MELVVYTQTYLSSGNNISLFYEINFPKVFTLDLPRIQLVSQAHGTTPICTNIVDKTLIMKRQTLAPKDVA